MQNLLRSNKAAEGKFFSILFKPSAVLRVKETEQDNKLGHQIGITIRITKIRMTDDQGNKQETTKNKNKKKERKQIMKKIALTFVALMMMTISYAETENRNEVANVQETGLTFDLRRLAVTLDLTESQMDAVKIISDNLNDELATAATAHWFERHALVQKAIRKDARHMRNVLNDEQYETYMKLLRATLRNKIIM